MHPDRLNLPSGISPMMCRMVDTEPPDERGWRRVKCTRPGCGRKSKGKTPYHGTDGLRYPCRAWPEAHEWGYWVSLVLEIFLINKDRWNWLRGKLGFIEPTCDCPAREAWLNTLPGRLVTTWRKLTRKPPPA